MYSFIWKMIFQYWILTLLNNFWISWPKFMEFEVLATFFVEWFENWFKFSNLYQFGRIPPKLFFIYCKLWSILESKMTPMGLKKYFSLTIYNKYHILKFQPEKSKKQVGVIFQYGVWTKFQKSISWPLRPLVVNFFHF